MNKLYKIFDKYEKYINKIDKEIVVNLIVQTIKQN